MIDLHVHSTASDGTCSPAEVIDLAADKRLSLIALTDHDTASGLPEFLEAAAEKGISAIGGIEISAQMGPKHVHILGYGLTRPGEELSALISRYQSSRRDRMGAIIERLRGLGIAIAPDEIEEESGGEVIGRPHIAAALVKQGAAPDVGAAFKEYLGSEGRAYVSRWRPDAPDAVALLRRERLVPVLAHPPLMSDDEGEIDSWVRRLRDAGLMGIETWYSTYSSRQEDICYRLAGRYGLMRTGGSDFHGANKPDISLGSGRGALAVPDAAGDKLLTTIEGLIK